MTLHLPGATGPNPSQLPGLSLDGDDVEDDVNLLTNAVRSLVASFSVEMGSSRELRKSSLSLSRLARGTATSTPASADGDDAATNVLDDDSDGGCEATSRLPNVKA